MLKKVTVLSLSLLILLQTGCGRSPEITVLADTGRHVIIPLHERFLAESLSLAQNASDFCEQGIRTQKDLVALQGRWIGAMNAWEGIQHIQFGPVTEDNQAWKVQFWPDRKNLIARKTEQFVHRDEAITLPALREASVVIQGLSAMEYLLYDKPAEALISGVPLHYCEHLVAAAANVHQVAEFLYQSWHPTGDDYLSRWSKPGPDNLDYPDQNATIATIIETIVYGLERIKRDKLERPLGLASDSAQANTYLLEWWRSQQSREAILVNLHSLQMLYSAAEGSGLAELVAKRGGSALSDRVSTLLDRAISETAAIEGSLFAAHAEPGTQANVAKLYDTLTELLGLFKRDIPETLAISLGFNANDGD